MYCSSHNTNSPLLPRLGTRFWGLVATAALLAACSTVEEPPPASCTSPLANCKDSGSGEARPADSAPGDLQGLAVDLPSGMLDLIGSDAAPVGDALYVHEDLTVQEVQTWITSQKEMVLLDVREVFEFEEGHLTGAMNLPWTSGVLEAQFSTLPTDKPIVVTCRSGNRSNSAANFLTDKGFTPVYDMLGGFLAWESAGYPIEK